jgi:voltage-dependent calcium channel L type alpha-1D
MQAFEWIVFGVIIASCFFLTIDTPNKSRQLGNISPILDIVDPVFVAIFALECLLKVVAHGFIGKPTAYLSDPMNRCMPKLVA